MGLRMDPMGGGQFKVAVQQLIEAETQPIKNLEARKAKEDTRLKLFGEFKTKFGALDKLITDISTFRKLRELKIDLGDGSNLISITADKERAEPGQYLIQIDELAARTSLISNGFENADDNNLGMGFISIPNENGDATEVYIDDSDSSLKGIAKQINQTPNVAVQASVIKDDSEPDTPWKLLLTAKKGGTSNQLPYPDFYFLDGTADLVIEDDKEAQNAVIVLDGFELEANSNDIPEFLPGVNAHLKQAKPDAPFTLTISEDYQKISGKVKALVDGLNQVFQFITKQNAIDAHSDTSTTFAGDSSLQSLEYLLRNVMHDNYTTDDPENESSLTVRLSQIGIEFDKTGSLQFKEEKFTKALDSKFDTVAKIISGPWGIAQKLRNIFDSYQRSGTGLLSIKEAGLRSRIRSIDEQIDQKSRYVERRKQDIVAQYSRLEATLGGLKQQQAYLSASLPGAAGGNIVSSLLG